MSIHAFVAYHYCLPFTGPRASPLKKLIITFANSLDLDQARHKKVGLDLHLNSVRSAVDPLMMLRENFSLNDFYANSLNQIKPNILMSGLTLYPRHVRIQMGEGVQRTPSKISQKYSFLSNWSGPLKNHKAT